MQRKKIFIYFVVHIDRENIQETPDFYACIETQNTHTHDACRTLITHTHDR